MIIMSKSIHTDKAPAAAGHYSQAIEKDNFLFISGQLSINPDTHEMSDDIVEQAKQSLKNIEAILTASNMDLFNVVKNTIFVTSFEQAAKIHEAQEDMKEIRVR